jgi:CRAL/TRIO domain
MLVLNAPSFFAFSWGLIKKFIDPRTAARIQLFANQDKGLRALEQLVDISELPQDYGGDNMSLQDAFLREASDPALLRQHIELLYCKKRKGSSGSISWTLEEGECMEISLYTRSVSKSKISVSLNAETIKVVEAGCSFDTETENSSGDAAMRPQPCHLLVVPSESLVGPGTVIIQGEDLDTATKAHSGMSRGYFLIVGDVKNAPFEEDGEDGK